MTLETIRQYCLSLPHVTEKVQWGDDLLFCIGGKMFALVVMEAGYGTRMSFKCSDERFHELLEREGVKPAPYLARAQWVAIAEFDTLPPGELKQYLREAYELILAKLPKKEQARIAATKGKSQKAKGKKASSR